MSSSSRLLFSMLRSERNRLGSGSSSSSSSGGSAFFHEFRLAFDRSPLPPPSTSSSSFRSLSSSSASSLPPGERRPTAIVYELLQRSEAPQTTAQLWDSAQESIKSKRHLKSLLTSLKNSGKVKTTPNASGRSYGYSIRQGPRQKSSSG